MFRSLAILCVCLAAVSAARAVTVSGHAELYGQSDLSGIRILFEQVSPSARTDSAFTNSAGSFSATLQPGVYNVAYSHQGWATYRQVSQVLLTDAVLDSVSLYLPLRGQLSGHLVAAHYQIEDSIWVVRGDSLIILPGTWFAFAGPFVLEVQGILRAVGTQADSVVFTHRYTAPDSLWGGITLDSASGSCAMEYCVIESATRHCINGNGISCLSSSLALSDCSIRRNRWVQDPCYTLGGGIYCSNSIFSAARCAFTDNFTPANGGAVSLRNSISEISDCTFDSNEVLNNGGGVFVSGGRVSILGTSFTHNEAYTGSAVCAQDSGSVTIDGCVFSNNACTGSGTISLSGAQTSASVSRCLLVNNMGQPGAGISVGGCVARITQSTIAGCRNIFQPFQNSPTALQVSGSDVIVSSCIFANPEGGPGVKFSVRSGASVQFCDFYGFVPDSLRGFNADAPPALGLIALTNSRGDSCDTYYNIFRDPQFVDTAQGDYHLRLTSPCIDAGDPSLPHDSDGTVADMGAFPNLWESTDRPPEVLPNAFDLHQNYPNPFNAVTEISFDLTTPSVARLEIFDITGRLARTLDFGRQSAGPHSVNFDGSALPSGLYFYRLTAGAQLATRKMILLK
jgi:hypothetical protein